MKPCGLQPQCADSSPLLPSHSSSRETARRWDSKVVPAGTEASEASRPLCKPFVFASELDYLATSSASIHNTGPAASPASACLPASGEGLEHPSHVPINL